MQNDNKTNCRILLIEDNSELRSTMVDALEEANCTVDCVRDGAQGLQRLDENEYEIVFVDVHLPEVDGIDVLERIRNWEGLAPPVVLMTSHAYFDTAVEAMKLGAADYIEKPVEPAEIKSLVRRLAGVNVHEGGLPSSLEKSLSEARRLLEQRQFEAAERLIRHALRLEPTSPAAFNLLGALMAMSGKRLASHRFFRAALSLEPGYEPAHENLARVSERPFKQEMVLQEAESDESVDDG